MNAVRKAICRVEAGHIDRAVGTQRRCRPGIIINERLPLQRAGRIESIEIAVVAAGINGSIPSDGRRGIEGYVRRGFGERPSQ